MKKIFLALLCSASIAKSQSVTYNVEENDPKKLKQISIGIDPFYAETYGGINFAQIGASVRGEALLFKRIELRGDLRMAYLDVNSGKMPGKTTDSYAICNGGTSRTNYFEGGATLYLLDWTRTRSLQITLSSSTYGGYTQREFIHVPGQKRHLVGVRGGLAVYNTGVEISDQNGAAFDVRNDTGRVMMGMIDGTTVNGSVTSYAYTMLNSSLLYAGLSIKSIINMVVDVSGYSHLKRRSTVYDVYADVITCPYVKMKDLSSADGHVWTVKTQKEAYSAIGWRAGLTFRQLNRVGLAYKFEVGQRPGIVPSTKDKLINGNVSMMLSIGFNIPFLKNNHFKS